MMDEFEQWLDRFLTLQGKSLAGFMEHEPKNLAIFKIIWQGATESMQSKLEAQSEELAKYKQGYERYETARLMNVQQWHDAYMVNIRTGKPFDQIIDELKLFYRPQSKGE